MKFAHIAFAVLLAGCAATTAEPPTAQPAKAAIAVPAHGIVKVVADAFADVPLRPEQRGAIEDLLAETDRRHVEAAAGMTEVGLTLADLILEGHIDSARFDPILRRFGDDVVKLREADRDTIAKMHGLLDHDQRDAIATAIEGRLIQTAADRTAKLPSPLFVELHLTDDQRRQLHAIFAAAPKPSEGPRESAQQAFTRQSLFAAVREDRLDIERVAPRHGAMQLAMFDPELLRPLADGMIAVLTPDQRKTASDWFRANASQLESALR